MTGDSELLTESSGINEEDAVRRSTADEMTAAEVLAEVERRIAEARRSDHPPRSRVVTLADRVVLWFSKHWLTACNAFFLLYVGLPFLAPVLMYLEMERAAAGIYLVYRPLCHQLPQRSFFLFGPQVVYTVTELMEQVGMSVGPDLATRAFIGDDTLGYKTALCQRDVAIYGAMLFFGLVFSILRRYWKVPALPWWAYIGFGVLPMLADGGYQFVSYVVPLFWPDGPILPHETTPVMRIVTGALFGLATVWLAYPLMQEAMIEVGESVHAKLELGQERQS